MKETESGGNVLEPINANLSGKVEAIHQSLVAGGGPTRMGLRVYIH